MKKKMRIAILNAVGQRLDFDGSARHLYHLIFASDCSPEVTLTLRIMLLLRILRTVTAMNRCSSSPIALIDISK